MIWPYGAQVWQYGTHMLKFTAYAVVTAMCCLLKSFFYSEITFDRQNPSEAVGLLLCQNVPKVTCMHLKFENFLRSLPPDPQ